MLGYHANVRTKICSPALKKIERGKGYDGVIAGPNDSPERPLGDGVRLLDHLGTAPIELESTQVIEAAGVTHLDFRVVK